MNRLILANQMAALTAPALEIATAPMLGSAKLGKDYDTRTFPCPLQRRRVAQDLFGPAIPARGAGRPMNLRIAQGIFHDEWLTEEPFGPDLNTSRLIAALDSYRAHGILAIAVSVQGGNSTQGDEGGGPLIKPRRTSVVIASTACPPPDVNSCNR